MNSQLPPVTMQILSAKVIHKIRNNSEKRTELFQLKCEDKDLKLSVEQRRERVKPADPISVPKVNSIIVNNIFECTRFDSLEENSPKSKNSSRLESDLEVQTKAGGLWIMPSFMNHSCTPNAIFYSLKQYCMVRAICNIHTGQEIFQSYIDHLQPVSARQEALKKRSIECRCSRCEKELKKSSNEAKKRWEKFHQLYKDSITLLNGENKSLAKKNLFEMEEIYNQTNSPEKYEMARLMTDINLAFKDWTKYSKLNKSIFPDFLDTSTDSSSAAEGTLKVTKPCMNWAFPMDAYLNLQFVLGENHWQTCEISKRVSYWLFPDPKCFKQWIEILVNLRIGKE